MSRKQYLEADYCPAGCRVRRATRGVFGDPQARVITLERLQKKRTVDVAGSWRPAFTIAKSSGFGTFPAGRLGFTWKLRYDASIADGAAQ